MSTRSNIGLMYQDCSIRYIYCHHDGYIDGVGKTLVKYYNQVSMIDALLDQGNLSSLGPDIGLKNDFNNRDHRFCVFYGRDRGDGDQQAHTCSGEVDFLNCDHVDYHYLFDDGKWRCFKYGEEIDLYEELEQ